MKAMEPITSNVSDVISHVLLHTNTSISTTVACGSGFNASYIEDDKERMRKFSYNGSNFSIMHRLPN